MFLNRKKYLENFGKMSISEVFLDFGVKKVKFFISTDNLEKFNSFKEIVERKFNFIASENQEFSLEQNLINLLLEITNEKKSQETEEKVVTINEIKNNETDKNLFTQEEVVQVYSFLLKNLANG